MDAEEGLRIRPSRPYTVHNDSAKINEAKATYKSWKKKYRKMRLVFDQKMREGEDLYLLEAKALETARRLAIQKDRLLDMLLEVNNSAQIPPERRFDLSLDTRSRGKLSLDIDHPKKSSGSGTRPTNSLKKLLRDVSHFTFANAVEHFPDLLADIEAGRDSPADPLQGLPHPPTFLTTDDVDNYLWKLDSRLYTQALENKQPPPPVLPTLASLAARQRHQHQQQQNQQKSNSQIDLFNLAPNGAGNSTNSAIDASTSASALLESPATPLALNFALRNPASTYNWIRRHDPKIFDDDKQPLSASAADEELSPTSARTSRSAALANGNERSSVSAGAGAGAAHFRPGANRAKRLERRPTDKLRFERTLTTASVAANGGNTKRKRRANGVAAAEDEATRQKKEKEKERVKDSTTTATTKSSAKKFSTTAAPLSAAATPSKNSTSSSKKKRKSEAVSGDTDGGTPTQPPDSPSTTSTLSNAASSGAAKGQASIARTAKRPRKSTGTPGVGSKARKSGGGAMVGEGDSSNESIVVGEG